MPPIVCTSTQLKHKCTLANVGVYGALPLCDISSQLRHNDHDSVSNHQPHGCLLNRLFRRRSQKTSKLCVTGLCVGNSPGPVNSPHKGLVTRKMFPFDDVNMWLLSPTFNPLYAIFFIGHMKIYLHFISSYRTDMTEVFEILPQVRQGITYSRKSISWVLMSWRHKEPGHQQPWYLLCRAGVIRSPNV